MIKITISRNIDDFIESIEVNGHANSAPFNEDLICAGVSSIITGTANALVHINNGAQNLDIKIEDGYAILKTIKSDDHLIQTVLLTAFIQLLTLEQKNSGFIKVIEKGV